MTTGVLGSATGGRFSIANTEYRTVTPFSPSYEAINALKRDIQQLRNKQRLYETQAAEKERGLMPVSREILTNLETVKHQIAKAQREIEARREERERVQVEFGRDLNRIYELYGLPPQPIAAT